MKITHSCPIFITLSWILSLNKRKGLHFLLLCLIIILNKSNANANYSVCDSWNIDFSWTWVIEICNWWSMTGSIIWIENFTWNFVNSDMWFWWNNNNYSNNINVEENLPFWYFNENKRTVIENTFPQNDNTEIWYWWNKYNFNNPEIDIENSFPLWFFDDTKITYINEINPSFDTPTWFLWSYILPKKNSSWKKNIVIEKDTYREFFEEIFFQKIIWNYNRTEKNLFINNLLYFTINWSKLENNEIDEVNKKRIREIINAQNFSYRFESLVNNLKNINNAFEKFENREERFYILKYYLDV